MNRTELIISFSSVSIALMALFVSIWQSIETREHNKNSLKPYLTAAPLLNGIKGENGVYIINDGVGPAYIKSAHLTVEGQEFDLSRNIWPDVYKHIGLKKLCYSESWFKKGSALRAGEAMRLLAPSASPIASDCPIEFIKLISVKELVLQIEYQSVYEDDFIFDQSIGLDRQEVETFKKALGI